MRLKRMLIFLLLPYALILGIDYYVDSYHSLRLTYEALGCLQASGNVVYGSEISSRCETGIEPLILSIPVNGRWYDWCGFSREGREAYYQKIRDICAEYQVALAYFSDKEYEEYFLKDIMHLGWKGWVYLLQTDFSTAPVFVYNQF